jgi:hypothetical protein
MRNDNDINMVSAFGLRKPTTSIVIRKLFITLRKDAISNMSGATGHFCLFPARRESWSNVTNVLTHGSDSLHLGSHTSVEAKMADDVSEDLEFSAMRVVFDTLKGLPDEAARRRVLDYATSRLGLVVSAVARVQVASASETAKGDDESQEAAPQVDAPSAFTTFAELFDAAHPQSNADKALVAGYWLQVCQGAESFSGQAVNNELKHLGEAIANITNAVDSLKNQKPALALQLRKSGKSQQARKSYKITTAGVKSVEAMLNG